MAPALATEMLVVPDELHYTYGRTTLWGRSSPPFPGSFGRASRGRPTEEILARVWGGNPCTYGGQCSTFSPFGEPYP